MTMTLSAMATYVYSPLGKGEIRLLVLEPRSDSHQVICRLEHRLLSGDPDFEALSYCWGVDSKVEQAICDGKTLKITASLFSALSHLSLKRKERWLWVDAICINQDDDHEKNHQVSMMGTIYHSARKTVVWLGEDKEVETAVGRLERLRVPIIPPSSASSSRNLTRQIAPIFDCAWFQRLWVVQEVALASECEVVAGYKQVALDKMEALLNSYSDMIWKHRELFNVSSAVNFTSICQIHNDIQTGRSSPIFLLELLQLTEEFDVTNKRDRLYALFGLSRVSKGFPIKYDNQNRTVNDVFVDFAAWALSEFEDLALLSFTRGPDDTLPAPSWAPSYGMCGLPNSFLNICPTFSIWGTTLPGTNSSSSSSHGRNGPSTPGSSDGGSGDTPTSWFDVDGQTLLLTGMFLDTVQDTIHEAFNAAAEEGKRRALDAARDWACRIARGSEPRAATIRRLAAALILESGDDEHNFLTAVVEHMQQRHISHKHHKRLIDGLCTWARYRCLGFTAGGRLAWLPRRISRPSCDAWVDDRICIFRGGRLPYVVRTVGDGTYSLVGECWVQGMMHGEWFLHGEVKLEEIHLI
jgi:hypothetical protein